MPSPVASLMSLSGTEGVMRCTLAAAHCSWCSLPSGPSAPSSRVAAARRIGGGFDKGICGFVTEMPLLPMWRAIVILTICTGGNALGAGGNGRPPIPVPGGK